MKKVLIVGGGLAGSCLGYQLAENDCSVTLIDSGINVSTNIAGGIIIPLVFRRMTKSWRIDEFLPYAKQFFQKVEEKKNISIIFPVNIRRFFSSEQERKYWLDRQETEEFSNYMNRVSKEDETAYPYANKFGSGRVKECYRVDAQLLLTEIQNHPAIECRKELVDYKEINPDLGSYKDEKFDFIVFCEGYQSNNNPWFSYLPVDPTKGEVLTVKTNGLSETESLNRKCSTSYIGNGEYKVGATYVWHSDSTEITEEGKELLLENLRYLTDQPVTVVDQVAGIRPTTIDRRPLMGWHPNYNKLAVFNGLGAKGFLLAPLLSKELADFLLNGKELDKECVLSRIKNLL